MGQQQYNQENNYKTRRDGNKNMTKIGIIPATAENKNICGKKWNELTLKFLWVESNLKYVWTWKEMIDARLTPSFCFEQFVGVNGNKEDMVLRMRTVVMSMMTQMMMMVVAMGRRRGEAGQQIRGTAKIGKDWWLAVCPPTPHAKHQAVAPCLNDPTFSGPKSSQVQTIKVNPIPPKNLAD